MNDIPDLDLHPTIWCGRDECFGTVDSDGTSWFCDTCSATWSEDGTGGEYDPAL